MTQQITWRHDPPTYWYKVHFTDRAGKPLTSVAHPYADEAAAAAVCDERFGAGNYRLEQVDAPAEPAGNVTAWGDAGYGAGQTAFEAYGGLI